jgi:signal transduction histidine kinase
LVLATQKLGGITGRSTDRSGAMLRSLRFQLPALFLLGVVVAGLDSAAIALRVFREYAQNRSREQAYQEVGREAQGLALLYGQQAGLKLLSARRLELATGDRIFYRGLDLFPGQGSAFTLLPKDAVDLRAVRARKKPLFFVFRPRGSKQRLLAAALPLRVGETFFGTIVVAKPETVLTQQWLALIERLLLAFAAGVVVAAAFAWYLSRRITTPVLKLSRAADEVARGHYDVDVPAGGAGEIGVLAGRFGEMASRLGEAEKLERNFLMTVSHELRTPLTAIRGHVDALREGVVTDEETRAASLTVIAAEAERLERLVGDVLDLAKLDTHRFTVLREEVDMERLVDRAYASFSEEARRRRIDYRCDVEAKPVIVSDGDRVLQIISNLLSNAFRWTPDGGRIELELTATDGTVYVAVGDSGPGIAPSERERIFRPFWSRDGGGTGLGLAIARELAAALGGRISLESSAEKGSRFELVLPTRT